MRFGAPAAEGASLSLDFSAKVGKKDIAAMRDRSAMVFQHYNLFPHMTVLQNIIEGPVQVQKHPKSEAVAEARRLLDRVGLADKAMPTRSNSPAGSNSASASCAPWR